MAQASYDIADKWSISLNYQWMETIFLSDHLEFRRQTIRPLNRRIGGVFLLEYLQRLTYFVFPVNSRDH